MPREKNHLPRFLSVAHQLGLLTPRKIEQVLHDQRRLREAGINEKVGLVAEHLGYLSPQDAEKVEGRRRDLRQSGQQMEDGIGWRFRIQSLSPQIKVAINVTSASIALAILIFVALTTKGWEATGIAASLLSLAGIVIPNLLLGVRLTVSGWLRWTGIPFSVLVSIILYRAIPSALTLPWWWYAGLGLLPLIVILESGASFWRNFKLGTSELRSCLIRCLTKVFRDTYITTAVGEQGSPAEEVDKGINEVMLWTARTVYLNPWNRLLRYVIPSRMAHPGVTSLWLFRPRSFGAIIEFDVSNHVVIGPQRVSEVFERFRERYHPRINFEELGRTREKLKEEGLVPENEFLSESLMALKSEYVSLPGLVHYEERGLDGDDVREFWGFEYAHYRKAIERETGDDRGLLKDSLWKAFAAYPVYRGGPQRGGPPAGVLVAFSNTKNGIINRDRNVLVSAARFIGLLLGSNNYSATKKGEENADRAA